MLKEGESIPSFSVPDAERRDCKTLLEFKGKNYCMIYPLSIKTFTPGYAPQKLMNSPKIMQNLLKRTYAS